MRKLIFALLCICVAPLRAEEVPTPRLQYEISNLETELSYAKQKIENQETRIETLRQEIATLVKATRETGTKSTSSQDAKIEKIAQDLKALQTHSNSLAEAIAKMQEALAAQKEAFAGQAKEMSELEGALKNLAKAIGSTINTPSKEPLTKTTYRVKPGDSLAKIAKELNTSCASLREANHLSSDKIFSGQELRVPE